MDPVSADACWDALHAIDPDASGSLTITHDSRGRVRVVGRLRSFAMPADQLVRKALSDAGVTDTPLVLLADDTLEVVAATGQGTTTSPEAARARPHGWLPILFQGALPTTAIRSREDLKRKNPETRRKVANCLAELGALTPIVLDPTLTVIDGELRLELARELEMSEVPVIVFDASPEQATFLRLVLNRSSEFQSWRHDEAGEVVDSMPNLQPLLEPLGFFGTRLLPVSYFSKNLVDYYIDADSTAQQRYSQELGLAQWALIQRERILEEERARIAKPLLSPHKMPKLFELPSPDEEDFVDTYDPRQEIDAFVRAAKEVAFEVNRRNDRRDSGT